MQSQSNLVAPFFLVQCFWHLEITNPTLGFGMFVLGPMTFTLDFANCPLDLIASTLDFNNCPLDLITSTLDFVVSYQSDLPNSHCTTCVNVQS